MNSTYHLLPDHYQESEETHTSVVPLRDRIHGSQIYHMAENRLFDILIAQTQDRFSRGDLDTEFPIDIGGFLADMRELSIEVHTVDDGELNEDITVILKGWLFKKENTERV